jgi:hypothetical protein
MGKTETQGVGKFDSKKNIQPEKEDVTARSTAA